MRSVAIALAFVGALAPAWAKAPPKDDLARQHYTAGMARYDVADFTGAVDEFKAGYAATSDPTFLYNIAQSYRQLRRFAEAADYYRRYLRLGDPGQRANVEVLLEEVEQLRKKQAAAPPPPAPPGAPPRERRFPPGMPLVEPVTHSGYLTNVVSDGALYTLVGLGVRRMYGQPVHGMALYVEDAPARAALARRPASGEDAARDFILGGEFGKIGQLHFVRGVAASALQKGYREALEPELPKSARMKKDLDRFIALFAGDVQENDDCLIRTSAKGEISVETRGARLKGPTNPELARAVWRIWLGPKPVAPELRKQLVNHFDAIAK